MNNKSKIYIKYERYKNASSSISTLYSNVKLKHVFHVSHESRETVSFTIIIHNYTRELALTKRTRYKATQPTHADMRRVP